MHWLKRILRQDQYGSLYIYEDGSERVLISSSIGPGVAQYTLVDIDGNGEQDILFNSQDYISRRWSIRVLQSDQLNSSMFWDGARFLMVEDLNHDGTADILIDMDGVLVKPRS